MEDLQKSTQTHIDNTLKDLLPGVNWSSLIKPTNVEQFKQEIDNTLKNLNYPPFEN